MAAVRFLPDDIVVEVAPGATILEAARQGGVPMASACGGEAACTTCREAA